MNKDLFDNHRNTNELMRGLKHILASPKDDGLLASITARPKTDEREMLESGVLDPEQGLIGDNWKARGFRHTTDGSAHPDMQLNVMNSRCIELIAGPKERWGLAGDQLYVDMDLSESNLPVGTQLSFGEAIIELTAEPHLGCLKFSQRFGKAATLFVNSNEGKAAKLRGRCAKVIQGGNIQVGQGITKRLQPK